MKLRIFCTIGFLSFLLANVYALINSVFWLNMLSHMGFYIVAFFLFFTKRNSYNLYFYLFVAFTIISYFLEIYYELWFFNEIALLIQAVSYLFLIMDATNHFKMKSMNYFMILYLFSIVGLNTYLLFLHISELRTYISSDITSIIYTFYYLNLGAIGVTAMVYYLNSFSKKSMYFISLAISLIFANVLRDMGVFYFKDISVEISESIIRMGSSIFLVLYFVTSEKRLKLMNFT